jgi:hypothetical protein
VGIVSRTGISLGAVLGGSSEEDQKKKIFFFFILFRRAVRSWRRADKLRPIP